MESTQKVALVTGASTGIGQAIAIKLAQLGYSLIITARSQEKLEQTAAEISTAGGVATIIPADLANMQSVQLFIDTVKEKFESIDVIVNVAGIWHDKNSVFADMHFEKMTSKLVQDTMNVGIVAPMLIVQSLISRMPQKSHIINLSGTFKYGGKGWIPYYVSKRALEDFTISLAQELEHIKIFVHAISPADTVTESYTKFFPDEDTTDCNKLSAITGTLERLLESSSSGNVVAVRDNQLIDQGFHL